MNLVLKYDEIVKKFNSDLVNKLRKHGSEENYLNLWVPDEDFLRSFESLIESIKVSSVKSFTLNVKKKFISKITFKNFKKKYPDVSIIEEKFFFLIYVKDLNVLEIKQSIIDKVVNKGQKKIDYSYGSLESQKNKKQIKNFFLDFFNKNYLKKQNLHTSKIKYKYFIIKLDKKIIYLDFNNKNEFIKLRFNTTNKYLSGCLFFFNKIFFKKDLGLLAQNGISEFLMAINQKCKNPIKGVFLPFNYGEEIFFVNLICQEIFKKCSKLTVNHSFKNSWLKKTLNEKKKICKAALQKFLKIKNEKTNSLVFKDIQNDINDLSIRIIVSTSELLSPRKKPNLLRKFEMYLKKEIDMSLQVLHEEKKDLSKIRRL